MQTKKVFKKVCLTVMALIACFLVVCLGFWLIDGRSPQAYLVAHALPQTTMEAYVNNFSSRHWSAMAEWAEMTGCGIVTPNYPLLFRFTAKDAHPLMIQLYKQLLQRYPAKRIMLMGDSAGGGFSLALAQQLKADSIDLPSRMVLISPWVDVVGGDDALQEYDTFLNMKVLRLVGADWAGDLDVHNPIVSPLYGNMQGLPPTDLFAGTWETLKSSIGRLLVDVVFR